MSARRHYPLRIAAWLQSPVLCDPYLPLDGAIFACQIREAFGPEQMTLPGECAQRGAHPQPPFKRIRCSATQSYYSCSFARFAGPVAQGLDHWHKRPDWSAIDLVDFAGRRGVIVTKEGRYRSYRMPVFYLSARAVIWFALGDRGEIERLLPHLTALGKKREMGWGSVLRWEVDQWREDWSVRGPGRMLMRAVPSEAGSELYGIKPPYWSRHHQCRVLMPQLQPDQPCLAASDAMLEDLR
jgi:hypothetical protein